MKEGKFEIQVRKNTAYRDSKDERGQSLTELALTLVLLLILVAGLIDLSRAFFAYMALRDAAQEGAVYGSIDPTNTTAIESRVRGTSQSQVDLTNTTDVSVAISYTSGNACASVDGSNGISVTVTYSNFILTTPFLGTILGSQTFTLEATMTDTILRPPC